LRAWRLADIPTPLPVQNTIKEVVMFSIHFSASLALDACATTSALVRQRLSTTSATAIASVLATSQPITGSTLASQRLAINRPLRQELA
jgi:hypothetical protein